ncbi:sensor histidine kinase [Lacticaseibacillus paracasei]|uniref:sensor histidine kinase n=1 Tax=Lacticaseibacillus paracasei TaxID=1597 RepID=UPI001C449B6D|nr:HAMP domain-containing sensor histidine kinase [Lacticaseibacillus paracasei]QXJ66767.1 HAMP domain-containing histidine kinase [Lacticaseibacillus paracasei subsp. paracasei]
MKKRKQNQSSAAIMQRSLVSMVATLILALGLLIVAAVGHQLYEQVVLSTDHIAASLKQTVIDGDDDWENWRKNSTLDTSSTYVHVHNMRQDAKVKNYYSPATKKVQLAKSFPFLTQLRYQANQGLFYYQEVHAKGIRYEIWQSMNSYLAVLIRVLVVTMIVLVLALVVSPIFIRRLAHRLTGPLSDLSQSTKHAAEHAKTGVVMLPVPDKPTEVTDLAKDFNDLLKQLHDRQEQQKLFIMNAAHELRTPIATIRSHAQLIERHGRAHPEIVLKSVNYITEESRQMQQLIEELLQLSRADRLTLDTHLLNLSETVQHLAEKLASAFSQTIEVHVTPNMSVESNESAIEQILDNFVTNAAKYSPADTIIAVNLTRDDDGNAVLAVLDQGAGISAEDKSHVFERFYRSANVRGTVPGTGLGLAIANQLATINNGRIKLRDNQPHGTIAELILPLATTKERHQLNES